MVLELLLDLVELAVDAFAIAQDLLYLVLGSSVGPLRLLDMVIVRGWDAVGWIGGAVGLGVPPHVVEVVHLPLFVVLEEPLIGAKVLRLLAVEALGDLVE